MNYSTHIILSREEWNTALEALNDRLKTMEFDLERHRHELIEDTKTCDKLLVDLAVNQQELLAMQELMNRATAHMKLPIQRQVKSLELVIGKLELKLETSGPAWLVEKQCKVWQLEKGIVLLQELKKAVEKRGDLVVEEWSELKLDPNELEKLQLETKIPNIGMPYAEYKINRSIADEVSFTAEMQTTLVELMNRFHSQEEKAKMKSAFLKQIKSIKFKHKKGLRRAEKCLDIFTKSREQIYSANNAFGSLLAIYDSIKVKSKRDNLKEDLNIKENKILRLIAVLRLYNPGTVLTAEFDVEMMELMMGVMRRVSA